MLYIQRATVYTPDRIIVDGAVLAEGGRIVAVGPRDKIPCPLEARCIDARGMLLVPGLIDLQLNGAFGHDFTADPASIWPVAAQLPRYGVTAFLATVITSPLETVTTARQMVSRVPHSWAGGAAPLGLHVEGPFLNAEKKGAHNPAHLLSPDLAAVRDWSPEGGVRLVTLAPEQPGALDLVQALNERGVVVSAGHSTATYAEALAGFEAGIRYGTHLFNAMLPMYHREPGLAGALLTDPRPTVGMIVDGVHTHPSMVDLAWRSLRGRLNLVTDAMAALGMPPGEHLLGDLHVCVDETSARLADGTLAGSILSLDQAVRNLIAFAGCSLPEALATVTTTPAGLLGLSSERGRVALGHVADLALLSPALEVQATVVRGSVVYERPAS
jgi:N-acetylglucosamine-6-phosphate deacetylase